MTAIAPEPRGHGQAMEGGRNSCPRLPAREDALPGGLVGIAPGVGRLARAQVRLTARGRAVLGAG